LIGENEERGYLYRQGDAFSLADKIQMVLNESSETIIEKLLAAQEFSKNTFEPKAYARRIYQLIDGCIKDYEPSDNEALIKQKMKKRYARSYYQRTVQAIKRFLKACLLAIGYKHLLRK
jgi:hypothetical protein